MPIMGCRWRIENCGKCREFWENQSIVEAGGLWEEQNTGWELEGCERAGNPEKTGEREWGMVGRGGIPGGLGGAEATRMNSAVLPGLVFLCHHSPFSKEPLALVGFPPRKGVFDQPAKCVPVSDGLISCKHLNE